MDFTVPEQVQQVLQDLDAFIEAEIRPLEDEHDNVRFFDHRREYARTDFEAGGLPRKEWEELLSEMRRRADAAGFLRYALPSAVGGRDGSNLAMAVVREHLAHRGLGLHNDLQDESSVVGNFPVFHLLWSFGTDAQKAEFCEAIVTGERRVGFGLTEPDHGSDATWMETTATRQGGIWVINGKKRWNTGMHTATHDLVFARTSGAPGAARGVTAFLVPTDTPGLEVTAFLWTFNMPTDHADVTLHDVRVPETAMLGAEGEGLAVAQHFVHENRIRQAASGVGARPVLHRRSGLLRSRARDVRQAARRASGDPVASGRAAHGGRAGPHPGPQDRVGARRHASPGCQPPGLDVQLPGQPARM